MRPWSKLRANPSDALWDRPHLVWVTWPSFPQGCPDSEYCRVFPLLGIFLGPIGKSLDHRPMRRRIANREGTKIWKLPYTKLQNTHRLANTRDKSYTNGKFLRFYWLFASCARNSWCRPHFLCKYSASIGRWSPVGGTLECCPAATITRLRIIVGSPWLTVTPWYVATWSACRVRWHRLWHPLMRWYWL